jgi:hypothetical protein
MRAGSEEVVVLGGTMAEVNAKRVRHWDEVRAEDSNGGDSTGGAEGVCGIVLHGGRGV